MSIIKTPKNGIEVELKEDITGKEKKQIKAPMSNIKFRVDKDGKSTTDVNMGDVMEKSAEIAAKIVVLKVGDGKNSDIWEVIENMSAIDYEFIMAEVDKVVQGVDFTKPVVKGKNGTSLES